MAITNIAISNFKSFKELDLDLRRFNVVIGANASGKSNLVEVFRFLKSIEDNDLDDAVSLHGGQKAILNRRIGVSGPLKMRVISDQPTKWAGWEGIVQIHEMRYEFALRAKHPQNGLDVEDEHFTLKLRTEAGGKDIELGISVLASPGERRVCINPPDLTERLRDMGIDLSQTPLAGADAHRQQLSSVMRATAANALLPRYAFHGFMGPFGSLFRRVGAYDIDPRAVKKPHEMAGRASLEESGENLALVLRNILADPEKRRKFHNLVRYMLPFVTEVGIEKYLGESVLLKLREAYYEGALLANLLSDGTVNVVALIVALFFEHKDVVIIEEPERNIHPHLISGLMELMKDAARNKQVIITTHSPEVVRHAGVENLLLMSRDKEGFSTVSRPAEKEQVKVFLENDLGLDEVFVQELWGM
jgi:predicted ATPase